MYTRFLPAAQERFATRINKMAENERKKVDFTIFSWAIGIIFLALALVGGTVSALSGRVEKTNETNNDLKVQVGEIKRDVSWIRETLSANVNQSKNIGGPEATKAR